MGSKNRHKREKTPKSGTKWKRDEIKLVMDLYLTPDGKLIHEGNPKIQHLAKDLGRTTRSVEAQLQMFRALDKGMRYSRNRMSRFCVELWNEQATVTEDTQRDQTGAVSMNAEEADPILSGSTSLYPARLIRWAGFRDGGVRKPFREGSGRPTGERIHTPLVGRLDRWVSEFVSGTKGCPTTVLLVGGPGNGKTEAIEGLIERLDHELHANGKLVALFASEYDVPQGHLPARKVSVDLSDAASGISPRLNRKLTLVQDATEGDEKLDLSAEQLLLLDLKACLENESGDIYFCCVNRGILAHAATEAHMGTPDDRVIELLNVVTQAVTSGAEPPPCWPLDGFAKIAVWPMDVESLVDDRLAVDGLTVAHQIFIHALAEEKWKPQCASGPRCPFCQNRKLLSKPGSLDALIQFLRNYELASGKRWTFRDIFSLVPYLLVGDYTELSVGGKPVDPCEWSAHQLQLLKAPGGDSAGKRRALFLLVSRLYHHRLFPRWPRLNSGKHRTAKAIIKQAPLTPGLAAASDLFRYLAWAGQGDSTAVGEIHTRMRTSFGDFLDPALVTGEAVLLSTGETQYTVTEIEEFFSLSIAEGFGLVKNHLETLERDLLKKLSVADEALVEDNFPRTRSHHAELLRSSLRQFAARLVKRSLGTRLGLCKDFEEFDAYRAVLDDAHGLAKVRRQLRRLLHDDRNRFRAPLTTTFGQPVAHRSRDVVLLAPAVSVRDIPEPSSEAHPRRVMPYFQIDKSVVPLTFSFFRALREVVAGLHDASLPPDIFALLNGIKLVVSGHVVHRATDLEDEIFILVGGTRDMIEVSAAGFALVEEDRH